LQRMMASSSWPFAYVARGKASGVEVDARGGHVWTLRAGRVVRWQVFGTKQEALEAAGLRE